MTNYIVLLRGINVGGHNKLPMQALRDLLSANDYQNVRTYIQSGNVFLESSKTDVKKVSTHIKQLILEAFGYDLTIITITKKDVEKCLLSNPYLSIADDLKNLHAIFLKEVPEATLVKEIENFEWKNDQFTIIDSVVFIHYPEGSRNSKLSAAFFEKKLQVSASARNWKTVLKLHELSI